MLVIFDCDGVLVDSEALAARVFSETLAGVGIALTSEQCWRRFRGKTLDACLHSLEHDDGHSLPDDFLARIHRATEQAFSQALQPVPGIESVLAQLERAGIDCCVASNGGLNKLRHSLAVTGLDRYFAGRFYSAEMVARGKPAPDLFIHAAQALRYRSADCIVVEDSELGLQAAAAAGMRSLYYCADNSASDSWPGTFTAMAELYPRLFSGPFNPRQ